MSEPGLKIDVGGGTSRGRPRRQKHTAIVVGVLVFLAGLLVVFIWPDSLEESQQRDIDSPNRGAPPVTADADLSSKPPIVDVKEPADDLLVADDGQTMWASPTAGQPIDWAHLPPGCQIFIALRPAALLQHNEGGKVVAALGPNGERMIQAVEQAVGLRLAWMDRLAIGLRPTATGTWSATYVVHATDDELAREVIPQPSPSQIKTVAGQQYSIADGRARFTVESSGEQLMVITSPDDISEMIELRGDAPPMRRDMEILAAATDSDRHVTLLVAPKSLLIEGGKGIFDGVAQRLEEPLGWLLGEHATAMELSLHWGDDFFLELRAAATIDTRAHRLADQLAGRMDELPVRLESLLLSLDVQPYGQRLLFRLPEMTRAAVRYSRHGFEEGHAMVRTCLPITAGHNLLMAGELALVEPLRNSAAAVPVSHSEPQTIEERLAATTSLSFARDTLETALQLLAEEMGVEIRINGEDLRAEGITRNQSFGIDLIDRPGSEILGEILRLANPDKTATGLDDPRQKLVYVVRKEASGRPAGLVVTTRAAATGRGETLPDVFLTP